MSAATITIAAMETMALSGLVAKPALVGERREGALRFVLALERRIGGAAVIPVELLAREVAVRVKRLDAAELGDLFLDQPVEVSRRMGFARALHVPEAEVDVPVVLHRVEREAAGMRLRADRADPLRPQADVLRVELQELRRAREWDIDVLDHRLGVQAEDALDFARDADAAIPAHDLGVGARAQPLSPIEAADERVLREHVLRAPEPVRVPAPDVVAHRQGVLALLADRAVVDALVGGIARVRPAGGEAPDAKVHLP